MQSIPDFKSPLLVVDDDTSFLAVVEATLVSAGLPTPTLISDSRDVMEFVKTHQFHVVLLDLVMPHVPGMEILKQIKEDFPSIECIITTAVDDVASAVEAMRYGAFDYLVKPIEKERLVIVVDRALERYSLKYSIALLGKSPPFSDLKNPQVFKDMVAKDERMIQIFHQVEVVAPTDYNVLITGETGTGKEMLAQIIHALSNRSGESFVPVNMGSLSSTLFDDEFFGHEKGAFTGAQTGRGGFLESAQHGTLYLDEITELDAGLQGKILRVIEERELYRLGSTKMRAVKVRFIASSNRGLEREMNEGRFRKDLFYRLTAFRIHIPPLRERREDILPLAAHFLQSYSRHHHKKIDSLAPDLARRLLNYSFPGNVRELRNIIAEAVLLEKEKTLTLSSVRGLMPFSVSEEEDKDSPLTLADLERQQILRVVEMTGGNRTKAAKMLGIGVKNLRRKLNKFDHQTHRSK